MAYDVNSYKSPFWAKSGDFIRGRDPLGIQNSSISLYARLLPGMTNLTLRLRYYGFLIWLLSEYELLESNSHFKESVRGQYNFLRRGELTLAYYMVNQYPDEQSVIGVKFATKNILQYEELGYYDIAKGADKLKGTVKNSVYWDYISGAFGQYYVGSFLSLGLVDSLTEGYFKITGYGSQLADAFKMTVPEIERQLFLDIVESGKLFYDDIEKIESFALNKNIGNTEEKEFYTKMLLGKDGMGSAKITGEDSYQRKQTINHFLNFLQNEENEYSYLDFPLFNYWKALRNGFDELTDAEVGWYYYYLNESIHFSLETIFWGMLEKMSKQTLSVKQFTEEILQNILNIAKDRGNHFADSSLNDVLAKIPLTVELPTEYVENINGFIKLKAGCEAISEAIEFLLHLYLVNHSNIKFLTAYAENYDLLDKNGNALVFFSKFFSNPEVILFREFVEGMIKSIINDHTYIAYRKMGNGEKNLLKFFVEDNFLIHIETIRPNFTSPRLRTLSNFMVDLGFVSGNGKVNKNEINWMSKWN